MYKGKKIKEIINEQLSLIEMPSVELQVRLGLTSGEFKELMNGCLKIDEGIANDLSIIFNTPKSFWYVFNGEKVKELEVY